MTKIKSKNKNKKIRQTVSDEVLKAWGKFAKKGDNKKLAEHLNISEPTALRILKYGYLNKIDLLETINNFFIDREKKEQEESKELLELASQK